METIETHHKESTAPQEPRLLDKIDSPADLRRLQVNQLPQLCEEVRSHIIGHVSRHPGHFASSMGAVELTVALHYVFNTPDDRIVWDVGHQAYAHKILTGRRDLFNHLREAGGISGFPNPNESSYDTFMAGHASNSISAALGMAIADRLSGNDKRKTVAVIGDASISGGLAFEGLNNVSNNPNNLLIILNDNNCSIDPNVGALHKYLSELTTTPRYNRWRYRTYLWLKRHGWLSDKKKWSLLRFNNSLKALISGDQNIFEGLNIRYFGPFDGHDTEKLVRVLSDIKDMSGPRILHLRTVKGKGFDAAEKDPSIWHAPGKFDPESGERIKGASTGIPKWQDVMGRTLVELADTHPEVTAITAAMPSGTSVNLMLAKYPERTFDVGISEGHAVTFAGGLAAAGKKPFVAIYSSFLQRAYDNIIHDVAIQGLPVTFCIDRAGVVGEDGVTHHGMFDLAYLKVIPGLAVASPADEETLRNLMFTSLSYPRPMAIRYPRGNAFSQDWQTPFKELTLGRGRRLAGDGNAPVAVVTIGPIGTEVKQIVEELKEQDIHADLYDLIWLKPLDEQLLEEATGNGRTVITIEDGAIKGGMAESVAAWMKDHAKENPLHHLGVPDQWVHHGTVSQLRKLCGYDNNSIRETIINFADTKQPDSTQR